jgi:hypothetical protein
MDLDRYTVSGEVQQSYIPPRSNRAAAARMRYAAELAILAGDGLEEVDRAYTAKTDRNPHLEGALGRFGAAYVETAEYLIRLQGMGQPSWYLS